MSVGSGYADNLGSAIEAASPGWGSPATINNRIPYKSETLSDVIAMIEDRSLRGIAGHDALDLGEKSVTGEVVTDIRYTLKSGSYFCGSDLWLSAAMGGAPAYNSGVNTMFLAASPSRPVTIAINKQVSIWEFISCMFGGFKISGKVGAELEVAFKVIAYNLLRTGTTNSASNFTALAANGGKRVLFADITTDSARTGSFRIGDIANALADGDRIGISDFSLDYNAGLTDSEFCTPDNNITVGAGVHSDARLTLQPERNKRREVTLDFTIPRYRTDQFFAWMNAGTELQCDITTSIDSAARTFKILMPYLKIVDVKADTKDEGMIPVPVKAKLLYQGGTSSATLHNDYMTNSVPTTNKIPEEFQIEIKNSADGRTAAIWS